MTTTTLERTEGLSVLNQAMAAIKEKIEEKRGVFNIQMEVSESHSLSFCAFVLLFSLLKFNVFKNVYKVVVRRGYTVSSGGI